jgi:hypothetical protein
LYSHIYGILLVVRTTVDIPDPTYRNLKARAARRGCSVKELILRGVEAELNDGKHREAKGRVALPLIRSKRPGWLRLSNQTIDDILLP